MPFLGNFCLFLQKAPTVVSVLLSHEAHYGGTQRTLMGPESLTPNWGRNCIDSELLGSTRQKRLLYVVGQSVFLSTENILLTFSDQSSKKWFTSYSFLPVSFVFFPVSKGRTEDERLTTANWGGKSKEIGINSYFHSISSWTSVLGQCKWEFSAALVVLLLVLLLSWFVSFVFGFVLPACRPVLSTSFPWLLWLLPSVLSTNHVLCCLAAPSQLL